MLLDPENIDIYTDIDVYIDINDLLFLQGEVK